MRFWPSGTKPAKTKQRDENVITEITAIFGLLVAGFLLFLVRRDHLNASLGLGWTLAVVLSALLGFAPSIFDRLASAIGVSYAPILGISLAIAALVIKALLSDIEASKMKVKHQRLVQKVALLESELKDRAQKPDLEKPDVDE